jgi:hypothetical protein
MTTIDTGHGASESPTTAAMAHPAFTPGKRHIGALLAALGDGDEERVEAAGAALQRAAAAAVDGALPLLASGEATVATRRQLARRLGQWARRLPDASRHEAIGGTLIALLRDADAKTAGLAAQALGEVPCAGREAALLELWHGAPTGALKRALLRALPKLESAAALDAVQAFEPGDDAEAARLRDKALLLLERAVTRAPEAPRGRESGARGDVRGTWVLSCRAGLEEIAGAELRELNRAAEPHGVGRLLVRDVTLAELAQARTIDDAGLVLGERDAGRGEAEALLAALRRPTSVRQLTGASAGTVRYRVDLPSLPRAALWQLVAELRRAAPTLVNDPRASNWELRVGARFVTAHPRRALDERFAYRSAFVTAASRPTLAAALVRVAAPLPYELVWDPFCGSGVELAEVHRRQPTARLVGTDVEAAAIAAARANVSAAATGKLELTLLQADALAHRAGATLIVTNPPMGRRVARGTLKDLLAAFAAHVAPDVRAGSRLAWLNPLPDLTTPIFTQAGLVVRPRARVDMGGFPARLELVTRA